MFPFPLLLGVYILSQSPFIASSLIPICCVVQVQRDFFSVSEVLRCGFQIWLLAQHVHDKGVIQLYKTPLTQEKNLDYCYKLLLYHSSVYSIGLWLIVS